jgi:hypothetical protein
MCCKRWSEHQVAHLQVLVILYGGLTRPKCMIHQCLFVVPCPMEVLVAILIFGQNEQMGLSHFYFSDYNTTKANHSSYSDHKVRR